MNLTQISLATDLIFKGNSPSEQAVALIDRVPNPLQRNDVVQFQSGEKLLVIFKSGHRVEFLRKSERKFRRVGGLAYRKWARASFEHEDLWETPYPVPAPKRARPFLRSRTHWPSISIPAGTQGVVVFQSFAENSIA